MRHLRIWHLAILIVLLIAADQWSKFWAVGALTEGSIPLLPVLDFSLAYNTGAAFSFLSDAGGWQKYGFIVVGVIVTVILFVMMRNALPAQRQVALACAFIIGGAIGNLIDRVRLGKVVDFIHVFVNDWHFPTFNIADTAITIGVILMIMDAIGWRIIADDTGLDDVQSDTTRSNNTRSDNRRADDARADYTNTNEHRAHSVHNNDTRSRPGRSSTKTRSV